MTSYIKFTPLSGAHDEEPLGYLLEADEYRILLDCGWSMNFDIENIKQIIRVVKKVDVILISHPDIYHLGALPYLVGKVGINAVILGTIPVYTMGQMFMYDAYQSKIAFEDFDVFDLDDVDEAFVRMVQLKYFQPYTISTKGIDIEFTAYNAGHMLGGSIWKIEILAEEIIYAVDYNHTKDKLLNPALLDSLIKPTILITDSYNSQVATSSRKKREKDLLDSLKETLHNGGNVLLPTDTAGRVLELLVCLDQFWEFYKLTFPIYYLHNFTERTIAFAETHLEWCNSEILDQFHTFKDTFSFKYIRLCQKLDEVIHDQSPKVVLASEDSLTNGFALQLLIDWAPNPRNRIIFTNRPTPGSLGRELIDNPNIGVINIDVWKKVPLTGTELEDFETERKRQREIELALKKEEEQRNQNQREQQERYEYNDDDSGDANMTGSFMWESRDLYTGFLDYEQKRQASMRNQPKQMVMFPFRERISIYDEYGEAIQPENYQLKQKDVIEPINEAMDDLEIDDVDDYIIPTKSICENIMLPVHSLIQYVDFEGRSDGKSIPKILNSVQPQQLILIHGTTTDTLHLAGLCAAFPTPPKKIFTPTIGETIFVTETRNVFKVNLSQKFFDSISLIPAENEYNIAYIDSMLVETESSYPHLDIIPESRRRARQAIFVGEVKLSDFRILLNDNGFETQFKDGVLICNSTVALRQTFADGRTKIHIQGALSSDYNRVRDLLYNRFLVF